MPPRIITVITDEGKTTKIEDYDATEHVANLELIHEEKEDGPDSNGRDDDGHHMGD